MSEAVIVSALRTLWGGTAAHSPPPVPTTSPPTRSALVERSGVDPSEGVPINDTVFQALDALAERLAIPKLERFILE